MFQHYVARTTIRVSSFLELQQRLWITLIQHEALLLTVIGGYTKVLSAEIPVRVGEQKHSLFSNTQTKCANIKVSKLNYFLNNGPLVSQTMIHSQLFPKKPTVSLHLNDGKLLETDRFQWDSYLWGGEGPGPYSLRSGWTSCFSFQHPCYQVRTATQPA